jgi:hypothetical protein
MINRKTLLYQQNREKMDAVFWRRSQFSDVNTSRMNILLTLAVLAKNVDI